MNKTNFHIKGFALGLALKQRRKATRKSCGQFSGQTFYFCCLANPFINKTSLDKVIREPVLLLFSEKDTLSLCSILACQTVNYCSAKAFSFAFRLDVLNLQQCSLKLFQICSVAAVMSCGSILSSGGQSVLLCVVGSRYTTLPSLQFSTLGVLSSLRKLLRISYF